jgi:hypothetical protein
MTTTTPVPLPVGAVSAEDWQHDAGRPYWCFQGEIRESPTDNQFGETIVGVREIVIPEGAGFCQGQFVPVFSSFSASV